MKSTFALLFVAGISIGFLQAADPISATKALTVFDKDTKQVQIKPSSAQVTSELSKDAAAPGLNITIKGGSEGYPGIELSPPSGAKWDLSAFGHVEAKVTNLGTKKIGIHLRIDDDGDWRDNPYNTESVYLDPGKSGTVTVIFGYSYGRNPSHPLKSAAVVRMLLFTGKTSDEQKIRLEAISATGPAGEKPPVDPASIRVKPTNGYLFGGGVAFDAGQQVTAKEGATAMPIVTGPALRLTFTKKGQFVTLKPPQGAWDLRAGHQVVVRLKNTGTDPVTPIVRVNSAPGSTADASPSAAVSPGQSATVVASFIPTVPWTGIKDTVKTEWNATTGTGTRFASDAANGITLAVANGGSGQFDIESVTLAAPPGQMPDWLGKRPPIEGEWTPTFREEFDGTAIDLTKWNIYTPNYWDKQSHFSKENVIVNHGVATLRFAKKKGRHNDDPNGKETDYATGYIDTYGKWVQRYGYFEARMKIPQAPGLWPAMWLMPDRGLTTGEQWKRADTGHGGMEFDVMEYLSRWGQYRFNVAFHWDGYGKEHKQTGSQCVYVEHDAEGFITTGLLWLPGKAVVYNNGRVVAQWESSRISNIPSQIMFTHVTGGWDNNRLDAATLPDDFVIDYVRCWQRKDLATPDDGVKSVQPTPAAPTTPDAVPR